MSFRKDNAQPTTPKRHRSTALPSLRMLRRSKGLTQRQLASRAKVTQGTICDLELGQRGAYPSTIRRLAEALKVEVGELVQE